jgi:hypothetical protein
MKKSNIISFLKSVLTFIVFFTIINSGYAKNVKINGNVEEIDFHGLLNCVLEQKTGGSPKIEIYGPDNIVSQVEFKLRKNILNINSKIRRIKSKDSNLVKIIVYAGNIKQIRTYGMESIIMKFPDRNNDITIEAKKMSNIHCDSLSCKNIYLRTSGMGQISASHISVSKCVAEVSGISKIKLSGNSINANYISKGCGNIEAADLKANEVKANTCGIGEIRCYSSGNVIIQKQLKRARRNRKIRLVNN